MLFRSRYCSTIVSNMGFFKHFLERSNFNFILALRIKNIDNSRISVSINAAIFDGFMEGFEC